MKVQVLTPKPYIKREDGARAEVDDVIEVAPEYGHPWAGIGLVRIVEHDKPDGRHVSRLVKDDAVLNHLERETGKPYLEQNDGGD